MLITQNIQMDSRTLTTCGMPCASIIGWMAFLWSRMFRGNQPTSLVCRAADLWAYELRHHFQVIRPAGKAARWPFQQFVKLGLNYDFVHDFITYHDENGPTGLGQMSRV